jgi:hypothetical protein
MEPFIFFLVPVLIRGQFYDISPCRLQTKTEYKLNQRAGMDQFLSIQTRCQTEIALKQPYFDWLPKTIGPSALQHRTFGGFG